MSTPARLSYTRCNELCCPYRYQQLYLRKVKDEGSEEAGRGKMLHEIAAEYIRRLAKHNCRRYTDMFVQVFYDHTARLELSEVEVLQEVGGNFVDMFTIDSATEQNLVEHEMAVNRQGDPVPMDRAVHPDGTAREDCFTGIADYIAIQANGLKAKLFDWKMGNQMYDMFEAQQNRQLQGYSYLHFKNDHRCEQITATLLAPKFRQISTAVFIRELLVPDFEEWLAGQWDIVDQLREQHDDSDWPAIVNFRNACNWCRNTSHFSCPLKEEIHAGSRFAA